MEEQNQNIPPTEQVNIPVPPEIKHWNWGAFFLSWIWGIFHEVWISLIALCPYVGLIINIILGIKGNEWAWQARRYNSVEEFKKREKKWAIAGAIVWAVIIIPTTIILLYWYYTKTAYPMK
jgi:hypothetical protein